MAQDRKHPTSCETATQEKCRCGHCAGAKHNWVGAVQLVKSATPDGIRDLERDADRRWHVERDKRNSKNRKQSKATLAEKQAAVDTARANLIRRLREWTENGGRSRSLGASTSPQDDSHLADTREPERHRESHEPGLPPVPAERSNSTDRAVNLAFDPAETDRVLASDTSEVYRAEALGHLLEQVLHDVEDEVGPLRIETRYAMADHFWCELLVQLVVIIEESNRLLSSGPDKVAKEIARSRRAKGLTKIQRKVVIASARQVWKRLSGALGLTTISDAKALLPVLRMLAVLMCKSPSRHTAVVTHCLDPLKTLLFQETKLRLKRVFSDLVPEITSNLESDGPTAPPR